MTRFEGWVRRCAVALGLGLFAGSAAMLAAGSAAAAGPESGGFDAARCGGFVAGDAAAILGVPASTLTMRVEQIDSSLWSCSFAAGDEPGVVFSIELAKTAGEAAAQMKQYRSHLEDNYSDLMGLGDEGVWTEVNHTVTYRKGNVTIQVQQPSDKMQQLRVVKALFDKN